MRPCPLALGLALCLAGASAAQQPLDPERQQAYDHALRDWGRTIGLLGYVYGTPLLELSIAEYRQTQGLERDLSGPRGMLAHAHSGRLPTHATSWLPAPDPDLLTSSAWLDVEQQPYVLFIPPMDGHWYGVQLQDSFTNDVGYVSSRTAGSVGGWYLLAHESFAGERPETLMGEIRIPTSVGWLLIRIAATQRSEADIHTRYQARFKLLPLSVYARNPKAAALAQPRPGPGTAPVPRATAEMRGSLDAFRVINQKLRGLDAPAGEQALLALFDRAGFGPSVEFDPANLPAPLLDGLRSAARDGQRQIHELPLEVSEARSAWSRAPAALGAFGNDYLLRAISAAAGLGAEIPAETLRASTALDGDGRRLDGRIDYRIRFRPDQLPPAKAFWSIAPYARASRRLMTTDTQRYSIGSKTEGLRYEPDGSLELWISSDEPEDPARRANWLPVRLEPFFLVARLHEPLPAALDGSYAWPPVVPADD